MTTRTDRSAMARARGKCRRVELLLDKSLTDALDNYRASKRPIPFEADAIRWLITEALATEGFEVEESA